MNNKTLIPVITLILVIMIAIGFSYAYFSANVEGEESSETLTVTGGSLSIAVDGGSSINIQNVIPGSEAKVTKTNNFNWNQYNRFNDAIHNEFSD